MTEKQAEDLARKYAERFEEMIVVMQAAWIEWKHGSGPEAAMIWIHNTLAGPGLIPDPSEPFGRDSQNWFAHHRPNAFPPCVKCGAPGRVMVGKEGYCPEHEPEPRALPTLS